MQSVSLRVDHSYRGYLTLDKLTDEVLLLYGTDHFVTIGDGSIMTAIEAGFAEIRSSEKDINEFKALRDTYGSDPRVTIYWGEIADRFPECICDIIEPITFWLPYTLIYVVLPLIASHPVKDHIILIGGIADAKVEHRNVLQAEIRKINPRYQFDYENSRVKKYDIMIAHIPREQNDD
jgi:hypothetical protein